MKQFTSTATKDGRWWVVQCDQEPGALSQVARLDQAAEHQREAISMVTGLDETQIEVEVRPEIDEALTMALDIVAQKREQAEELQRDASNLFAQIAHVLTEDGLSLRDAAVVLGVSHQRVAQLVSGQVPIKDDPLIGRGAFSHETTVNSTTVVEKLSGAKTVSRSAKSGRFAVAAKSAGRKSSH